MIENSQRYGPPPPDMCDTSLFLQWLENATIDCSDLYCIEKVVIPCLSIYLYHRKWLRTHKDKALPLLSPNTYLISAIARERDGQLQRSLLCRKGYNSMSKMIEIWKLTKIWSSPLGVVVHRKQLTIVPDRYSGPITTILLVILLVNMYSDLGWTYRESRPGYGELTTIEEPNGHELWQAWPRRPFYLCFRLGTHLGELFTTVTRCNCRYTRKPWDTSFVQEAKVFCVLKQAFP
jgi:hypothetical protein